MMRQRLALPTLLASLLLTQRGAAQDKPQDEAPSQVSVPRGAGGAVVKKPAPDNTPPPQNKASPPRPKSYVPPDYPPEAKKKGLEAEVILQIDVDKEGKVEDVQVLQGAGNGFDEAAVAAAKKIPFDPARRADGSPAKGRINYRYSFTLTEDKAPPPPAQVKPAADAFSGTVLVSGGDVPLAGANVSLVPVGDPAGRTPQQVTTDVAGKFRFKELVPGTYRVTLSADGYEGLSVEEVLKDPVEVKYRLLPKGGGLEVIVRGDRPPREVVKRTLEQREVSRIPGTNGDALKSIQSLPGVARPPGVLGLLIVRGSGPQDTQTFIDGTPVPLIYHFGGLSSVLPTELLDKIDFYPGNFSAQYGRVQGGIVDAGIRGPNPDKKYHGLVQVDLIDVRALVEGPIPYLDGWSFAAAGRRSYVDAWLGPVLRGAGAGVTQAPVYYDYQFLIQKEFNNRTKVRFAFFGSDDQLKLLLDKPSPNEPGLSGNIGFSTAFMRLQARVSHEFENGDRLSFVTALGRDSIQFGLGAFFFLLDLKTLTGRLEYSKKINKGITLNAGLDMFSGLYDVRVRGPAPPRPGEPPNQPFSTRAVQEVQDKGVAYQPAAYLEAEIVPHPNVRLVPGVRLDYFKTTDQFDVSPRFNGRFDIKREFPRSTIKTGVGFYHQPPQFQEAGKPYGNPRLKSNRAIHYALGFEQEITRNIQGSVEGFVKQLDSLVVAQPANFGASLIYTNLGKGYVVGGEFLLKYKPDDRFFGWFAYTLSRSTRIDGPDLAERMFPFDQTHIMTVLGSYRLGWGWEIGARFRLISGNLITPNVCNPNDQGCDPSRTGGLFHAASGVYTAIPFSGPYSERLPLFHQLDLRVDKRWQFKYWSLSAYLDIQNVYNNQNTEGLSYNYNYTARQYVSGLPILPSIGLRGEM